jgi:hypothetical protein
MKMNTIIKNIKVPENPFILFSPFLALYIIITIHFQTNQYYGDEDFYLYFAHNLLHGFYSPPPPKIVLHYGPGYPLFLVPFVALNIPHLFIKLMNPVFNYLSIIFIFKALKYIVPLRTSIIFSLFWAFYYNSYNLLYRMHSEILASFLVSLLILFIIRGFSSKRTILTNKYIYLSGFIFGYIALTKVIFGYVILVMFLGSLLLWLTNRKSSNYRRSLIIVLLALVTLAPYLIYTYQLTGRVFFMGTTGGSNLYWMSSLPDKEYGDWYPEPKLKPDTVVAQSKSNREPVFFDLPGTQDSITLYHRKDFIEIYKYSGLAQDDAYKRIAINNIKSHPVKFIRNCICNCSRILFNFPFSYRLQRPGYLLNFPLNMIILIFGLICIIPTIINWQRIIFSMRFMLCFSLLYLGGSVFGSAEIRMFTIIVPMLLFWIAYILDKSVKFNLHFDIKPDAEK